MKCPNCRTRLVYTGDANLIHCVLCGNAMIPSMTDVFANQMYGITNEHRPIQVQLADTIDKFYEAEKEQNVAFMDGGTGIGKSFAYLVPALSHCFLQPTSEGSTRRIVVSTAKKNLQEQLVYKDIPYLLKKMGISASYTIMKGNDNYLCLHMKNVVAHDDRPQYAELIAEATKKRDWIDITQWQGPRPLWWDQAHVGNCHGKKLCPVGKDFCKPKPAQYDIVVVNHHLLAIDFFSPGHLFGPYQFLIIDEAHQAMEAFRTIHTEKCAESTFSSMVSLWDKNANLLNHVDSICGSGTHTRMKKATKDIKLKLTGVMQRSREIKESSNAFNIKDETLNEQVKKLFPLVQELQTTTTLVGSTVESYGKTPERNLDDITLQEIRDVVSKLNRMQKSVTSLSHLLTRGLFTADNYVWTIDNKSIASIPLHVGPLFSAKVHEVQKCIVVSATLAINGDFKHAKNMFGIKKDVPQQVFNTPFDLHKQARLYMPPDMPLHVYTESPERTQWVKTLSTEIAQISGVVKSNILILFTSRKDKDDFFNVLCDPLENLGFTPIDQGDSAPRALTRYLSSPKPVLFGLKSFWEGLDLPGNKLRCVIIPRLPFPNPNDPIISKLCKETNNYYNEIMIPNMIFDMKQGTGRLIRSMSDRGIIAVLDPRIWSGTGDIKKHAAHMQRMKTEEVNGKLLMRRGGYGKTLLDALGYTIQSQFTVMEKWAASNMQFLDE